MGISEARQHPPRLHSHASLWARHVDGGDVWTLELAGEADIATLRMLREELARAVGMKRARSVIDLSGLRFCDVVSAELIMSVSRTSWVSLTGAAGSVKRVFDLLTSERYPSHPGPYAPSDLPPRLRSARRRMVRGPPGGG